MRTLQLFLLGLLLGTTPPAAAQRTAGEKLDDGTLTARVNIALLEQSAKDATSISVTTEGGLVQLSGWAKDEATRERAGRVARGVDSVKEVSNRLVVFDEKRSAGRTLDDSILSSRVKKALSDSDAVKASRVKVHVRAGVVALAGFAASYAERDAAVEIATRTEGVDRVINVIDVVAGA
ncbi:MAG: BON domain-containing protein [Woeseiaceae bacterium]|nr:BON domain-containing protein [Woeseiaceae bacterium]